VIAITDLESATEAVKEVKANYKHHSAAATEIANEYFDSSKILGNILERA
jgi:hypothetical protein